MQNTINRLIEILNRYSIKEVNSIYREKEVELEIASFTKHPDVKFSESLKQRMIQSAKRKRISPRRIKYLEDQISELNSYNQEEHEKIAIEDLFNMLKVLDSAKLPKSEIVLLHIEFNEFNPEVYIHSYGNNKITWHENGLGGFVSYFSSARYLAELDSQMFISMSEQLEIIEIEDEEYPQMFTQIRELRVIQAIKIAMEQPNVKEKLSTTIPKGKIVIGFHGDELYTIHESG
jgi:hypothetical protein